MRSNARGSFIALLILGSAAGCGRSGNPAAGGEPDEPVFALQLGDDLDEGPRDRIESLLLAVDPAIEVLEANSALTKLPAGSRVLSFGHTTTSDALVPSSELAALGSEGFVIRRGDIAEGVTAFVAVGNPRAGTPVEGTNLGSTYGSYALLEELGFLFLHPLAPESPGSLALPETLDRSEAPRWPKRGSHLHTMHPLELTDLLNGWGIDGPDDATGWAAMLPEWELALEWLVANRHNEVEWVLLMSSEWQEFADGPERIDRLTAIVDRAHAWGIAAGADAPIALRQQHTWALVRETGTLDMELQQIRDRLDYLMGAGFDFFATESGFSEFTSPDSMKMLAWMDEVAIHLDQAHGVEANIKVHVSSGQEAAGFTNPLDGTPLNFNWLPHYADERLGVLPHTVQHYGLDDPAPTYGNDGFSHVRDFLRLEAGSRETIWHPETAYWVSFDIDVPLFLPIYPERRVHDLRLIAADEDAGLMGLGENAGSRIDGQMYFSSGWEWGYWLNDVITARAAWNPHTEVATDAEALALLLEPVVRAYGPKAPVLRDLLVRMANDQRDLLILGKVNGSAPADTHRVNGQAYLQGWETWDDVSWQLDGVPGVPAFTTQPGKLGLVEMRNPLHPAPAYTAELDPLLAEMEETFGAHADEMDVLASGCAGTGCLLLEEMADASRVTALRARQVHALYLYVDGLPDQSAAWRAMRLGEAETALDDAQDIVNHRETLYRVPADRIAGWRSGPTAYEWAYLWSVRSLHFWWRDQGKAVLAPASPCYLNVIDPVDVAFGEGIWTSLAEGAQELGDQIGLDAIADCLDAPDTEPPYPPSGL